MVVVTWHIHVVGSGRKLELEEETEAEVITYLRHLPKYNNTSMSYEVILKTDSRWRVFPQVAARAPHLYSLVTKTVIILLCICTLFLGFH